MYYNKDWFSSYQLIVYGKVLMGNNGACMIINIGIIQIKIHDNIIRTLIVVRYIPKLEKILISLGIQKFFLFL